MPGYFTRRSAAPALVTDDERRAAIRARVLRERSSVDAYSSGPARRRPAVRRTSPIATAAIVCAFLLPIVGFALGIVGAVKLDDDSKESGQGLSIAAIIVSVVVSAVMAAVLTR